MSILDLIGIFFFIWNIFISFVIRLLLKMWSKLFFKLRKKCVEFGFFWWLVCFCNWLFIWWDLWCFVLMMCSFFNFIIFLCFVEVRILYFLWIWLYIFCSLRIIGLLVGLFFEAIVNLFFVFSFVKFCRLYWFIVNLIVFLSKFFVFWLMVVG